MSRVPWLGIDLEEAPSRSRTPKAKSPWISRLPTPEYMRSEEDLSEDTNKRDSLVEPGMFEISVVRSPDAEALLEHEKSKRASIIGRPVSQHMSNGNTSGIQTPKKLTSSPPAATWSRTRDIAFIFNVFLAQFLGLGCLAQTVAPILILSKQFDVTDPGQLSWYTAAYSLTTGTFILPAGRLGDMYGHKKIFVIGWLWFAAWSAICGASAYSGPNLFNAARAIQGIGPALLIPNAMALIGRNYGVGIKKNLVFAFFGAGGPTGFVVGNVMTSVIAEFAWWPWAFYVLAFVCVAVLGMTVVVIPADLPPRKLPAKARSKPTFDYLGTLTGVTGLVLFNYAWNQAAVIGWNNAQCITTLVVGVVTLACFFLAELRFTRYPLIPLRGLKKEAAFALACVACGWAGHGIWLYYWFWLAEYLREESALVASVQIVPAAITGLLFAFLCGFLMIKTKPAFVMLMAMSCFLTGMALMATVPISQNYWIQTFLSAVIAPGGMNMSFPSATIILSGALPKEHQGIAASLVAVCVNYSISIGLGLAGTVDRNVAHYGSTINVLNGYRGAWYFALGVDGLGLLLAVWFLWRTRSEPWGVAH